MSDQTPTAPADIIDRADVIAPVGASSADMSSVDISPVDTAATAADALKQLASQADRGPRGRFAKRNTAALTTGAHSQQLDAVQAPLRQAIYARTLTDLGVTEIDAPATVLAAARAFAATTVLRETLTAYFDEHPVVTNSGRTSRVLASLLKVVDREVKLIQLLGLKRVPARTQTPLEWMNEQP